MTLTEEAPDYAEKVAAYLEKAALSRRLPWGTIVANGHLVNTTSSAERTRRQEMGETAIRLLLALGVTLAQLEAIDELEGASPLALVQKLEELQHPAPPAPPAPRALPDVGLGR